MQNKSKKIIVDKNYCMSSFLTFRTVVDHSKCFFKGESPRFFKNDIVKEPVYDSWGLEKSLSNQMNTLTNDGKAALALSGGIDSAILAKFMPKGSTVYTFKCVVPGKEVTNEVPYAKAYADECGLVQKVIEITWDDMEKYAPILMRHKGAPIHSIEVQIYKAALQAKEDGFERLIFGESADVNYAGLSGLMSRDWTLEEFIERYSFVDVKKVLKEYMEIREPFMKYLQDGFINVHEFIRNELFVEAMGSYENACGCAGIEFCAPYGNTYMACDLDIERVRAGENKYLIREVFNRLYNGFKVREKLPMPRPTAEWLKDWEGPKAPEFIPNCQAGMTGDQKWMIWALEQYVSRLSK